MKRFAWALSVGVVVAASGAATAAEGSGAAVVCNVKVLSDKVQDVSSLEAWKKSFIKEGASDKEKVLAVWNSVVTYVHEDSPPRELMNWEGEVNDPIKTMNVYGYALCNNTAAEVLGLARYAGFKTQGWSIQGHVVADLRYDDAWHYFDASFIEYFPKADGLPAGVAEVFDGVKEWYEKNPEYKGNQQKLREFCKNEGWKNGPEVMSRCPLYDKNGNLPAKTHGWYSSMREFDGTVKQQGYESGVSNGYCVNIQLRPGERLVRNWGNKGLDVNMLAGSGGKSPHCIDGKVGAGDLVYTPKWGDLAPGRVGNGTAEYDPVSAGVDVAKSAFEREADGVFVVRMPSSYVYLDGKLDLDVNLEAGKTMAVVFSDNNGLDWKPVATIDKSGPQTIDLKELAGRRYDYRLKFSPQGKAEFKVFKITHDIQCSQRALPALDKGENKITFSAGPQEGTITVEGSTTAANEGKQLTIGDFHAVLEDVSDKAGLMVQGGQGSVTIPVKTPGEMTAIRVGTMYRAADAGDTWRAEASFDEGKTWKKMAEMPGGARFNSDYTVFRDIPAGTKAALVRWSGTRKSTLMIFNIRLDADYKAPGAGFAPVKVTYAWEEDGKEKRDEHVAAAANDAWTITCAGKPVMKSITLELAK